jgi:hypothetical protein
MVSWIVRNMITEHTHIKKKELNRSRAIVAIILSSEIDLYAVEERRAWRIARSMKSGILLGVGYR